MLNFSFEYYYSRIHTLTSAPVFSLSRCVCVCVCVLALMAFHHCSHSKWIGNNESAPGENMFCMRFDVVCFWWQKQKYCFFTAHPTHFVNRYCALVVGGYFFFTLPLTLDRSLSLSIHMLFFGSLPFDNAVGCVCVCLWILNSEQWTWCDGMYKCPLFVHTLRLHPLFRCVPLLFFCAFDTLLHELSNF